MTRRPLAVSGECTSIASFTPVSSLRGISDISSQSSRAIPCRNDTWGAVLDPALSGVPKAAAQDLADGVVDLQLRMAMSLGLFFDPQIVFDGLHTRDLPGRPRGMGAGREVGHLAAQ